MARKNDGRKTAASGRKGAAAKPHAGRAGVSKRAAQPAAKGVKGGAKPAAATPAPAKVKFRGRVLENEPLARYTTYRLGGPARYFVLPADPDDVAKALDLAQERGLPWLALGLGSTRRCSRAARRRRDSQGWSASSASRERWAAECT